MALLGIAQGAASVAQKLFSGIKRRREAKLEKRAAGIVANREKLAAAEQRIFSGGRIVTGTVADSPVSQAGANFSNLFFGGGGGAAPVNLVDDREEIRLQQAGATGGGGGLNPQMITILAIGAALILFGKKLFR
jgi:hypothetical protein